MVEERNVRKEVAQQVRLWLLSLACATPAAIAVYRTNSFVVGLLVFLSVLSVLGPALLVYEKKRKRK